MAASSSQSVENDLQAALEKCIGVEEARLLLNNELQHLDLPGTRIGDEGAKSLAQALGKGQCNLQSLSLEYNHIGEEGAKSLAEALGKGQCNLQSLNLEYNQIGDEGAKSLAEALGKGQCNLHSLNLVGNQIGEEGAKSLAEALGKGQCNLQILSLTANKIGDEGAKSLAQALGKGQCNLQSLNLEYNQIGDEGAKSLAEALGKGQCNLHSLNLVGNQIGEEGAKSLAEALGKGQCNLQSLNLEYNQIGDEGAKSLAEALGKGQCNLQSLVLSANLIGDEGAKSLAEALGKGQCNLQSLVLSANQIGEEGAKSLAEALGKGQCNLHSLNLGGNQIGEEGAKSLAEALGKGQCNLQSLVLKVTQIGDEGAKSLSEALGKGQCNLHSLNLVGNQIGEEGAKSLAKALKIIYWKLDELMLQENPITKIGQVEMLNGLKMNFKLKVLRCDWESYLLRAEAENLLKRNKILSSSGLVDQQKVSPNTAKLFICGDAGVGKSTIRKGLTTNSIIRRLQSHHRHPTVGMDLTTIQFSNQQLQICDLAGQKEYHAFHHLFLKGSDKDIFLVVCKAPTSNLGYSYPQFQSALDYWLRFIASHRSSSSLAKPKVFIVVNYFRKSRPHPKNMNTDAFELVRDYLQVYSSFLDFSDQHNVWGLMALDPSQFKPLKLELQQALNNLLQQRSQIPQVCGQIVSELKKAFKGTKIKGLPWLRRYPKVISFQDFLSLLENLIVKHTIPEQLVRDAAEHLFDMGELIYFKDTSEFIILDVQWFVREVIGVFIHPEATSEQRDHFELLEVRRSLMEICEETYFDAIMSCLERLGVLYRFQEENKPMSVLVPALLKNPLSGWPEGDLEFFYIGRRYSCTEKKHMLLPSGIFTMMQVQLKQSYPNPYHVGDGWISFTTKSIGITFILKIGGEKDHWTDRHWIDIMLRVPLNKRKNPEVAREFFEVRDKVFSICASATGVSLDEFVIRPQSIQELEVSAEYDVALFSSVKIEAQEGGFSCYHTWNAPEVGQVSRTIVSELLFIQEWEEHTKKNMEKLMKYMESEIESLACGQKVNIPVVKSVRPQLCKAHTFNRMDLLSRMDGKLNWIIDKQNQMEAKSEARHDEILKRLDKLQSHAKETADKFMLKLSILMEMSAATLPCLPYFTDESNCIQKLTAGFFGKKFRLHLLCESKMGGGHHMIPNQKGISVTVPADWMVEFSQILAPALTCIALTARVAAIIAGVYVPDVPTSVLNIFTQSTGIGDIVKSMLTLDGPSSCDLLGKSRSDGQLRKFFQSLLQKGELDMESAFGLQQVMFKGKVAWVCSEHAKFGQSLNSKIQF